MSRKSLSRERHNRSVGGDVIKLRSCFARNGPDTTFSRRALEPVQLTCVSEHNHVAGLFIDARKQLIDHFP